MKETIDNFIFLEHAAQLSELSNERLLEIVIEKELSCYLLVDFITDQYEFKYDSDRHALKVLRPKTYKINDTRIMAYYKLDELEIDSIYSDNELSIQKFQLKYFFGDINLGNLPDKIENEPFVVSKHPQTYTYSHLLLLMDEYLNEFIDKEDKVDIANDIAGANNIPEIVKIALEMKSLCDDVAEDEYGPTNKKFIEYLYENLNFTKIDAETIWNIIRPNKPQPGRPKNQLKSFDYSTLDKFKRVPK